MIHFREDIDELREYDEWIKSFDKPQALNPLAAFNPDFWQEGQTEPIFQALSWYGYSEVTPVDCLSPALHERLWPDIWNPGINHTHEQARGLVMAMPMWERSGRSLSDLHSGNVFRMGG